MHGIVTLLDNDHYRLIEDLWAELERRFSVHSVYITPYPHFSYHVAQDYDLGLVESILKRISSNITTFKVRTSGLGIFTGASPVLYIPVVRSLELTQLHEEIWKEIATASSGVQEYYHPEQWMPHITIGFGDINKDNLSQIIPSLANRDFKWEITVDNFAVIYDTGTKQELNSRFEISNEAVPDESSLERQHLHSLTGETVEGLRRIQERIRQESKGYVFEDSAEAIRRMREERTEYLMQLHSENEAPDEAIE